MIKLLTTKLCSAILSLCAMAISIFALIDSHKATDISQRAYQRSSGQLLPTFNVACDTRHVSVESGKAVLCEAIPAIVENKGSEAIAAVRFEVTMNPVWSQNRAYGQTIRPQRFSHEFNEILLPGKSATVDLLPYVLDHLKLIKAPPDSEQTFWTACSVVFSAQLVGESHFASTSSNYSSDAEYLTNVCSFGLTSQPIGEKSSAPLNFGAIKKH